METLDINVSYGNGDSLMIDASSYFYVYPGMDHVFQYLLSDLEDEKNCVVFHEIFSNRLIKFIWKKIDYHPTLNYLLNDWMTRICASFFVSPKVIKEGDIFIFSNIAIQYVSTRFLKLIKRMGGQIVLYFLDDITNINSRIALRKTREVDFDIVFSFDKKNAEQYGFQHMNTMYSRLKGIDCIPKYGIVFIGSDKKRFGIIENVYQRLTNEGTIDKHFFSIFQTDKSNELKYQGKMRINQSMDYKDVIKIVQQSNCILDIVIGEQVGLSLRAYEAIVYNKKLLTNNPEIFNFQYYDNRFMQYFSRVDEIDVAFVTEKIDVDYGYQDEFSPIYFLLYTLYHTISL